MKDVFNMDEIRLFYRLQPNHYLQQSNLKVRNKTRSIDNVASENLDQHSDDGGVQQLHVLIKELKYRDTIDVEYLLNYPCQEKTRQLQSC
ncbi:hypothetical protein QYF36_021867 [Acer negundo]|nr:hypothetical protein QYF36_021867 [Acer negundo]